MKHRQVLLLLASIVILPCRIASAEKPISSTIPTAVIGPYPIGLVFPGFNIAAGIDAAALPSEKGTAFQIAATPPINGDNTTNAFASVATSNKKLAIGAGYLGNFAKGSPGIPSSTSNNVFGGLGYRIDPVSIGIGVRDYEVGQPESQTQVDLSLLYNGDAGLVIGGVAYDVNNNFQLGLGVGYHSGKKYHVEADLLLPPSGSSGYILAVAGGMSVPIFDIFFNLSYLLNNGPYTYGGTSFFYGFGLAFWLSEHFNLVFQYNTLPYLYNGVVTAGFTIVL